MRWRLVAFWGSKTPEQGRTKAWQAHHRAHNLGVVLAIQKGRCSNYGILRIRRISAHCLAAGIRLHVMRIPSESNVTDKPSRWCFPRQNLCPLAKAKTAAGGTRTVTVFTKSEVSKSNNRMKSPDHEEVLSRKRKSRSRSKSTAVESKTPTECRAKEARISASERMHDSERKFAHRLRATWGEAPSWSPTMRDFLQRLEKFYDFVRFHQLEIKQKAVLDAALCDYMPTSCTSMARTAQQARSCKRRWSLFDRKRQEKADCCCPGFGKPSIYARDDQECDLRNHVVAEIRL